MRYIALLLAVVFVGCGGENIRFANPGKISYADSCVTSVHNATLHIPEANDLNVTMQDTIAALTPQGDCVGWGVRQDSGVTFAAAESSKFTPTGYVPGERIGLQISKDTLTSAAVYWPRFRDCEDVDQPICADSLFESEAFYEIWYVEEIY